MKRTSAPCPVENPCSRRPLAACSNAGGTGPVGSAAASGITSTEWGRFGSSFLKWRTTVHPCGTVSTRPPRPNPLKFMPPLASVRPATSLKSTVLLAASARSQVGSILPPLAVCARAPTAPKSSAPLRSRAPRTRTVKRVGRRIMDNLPPGRGRSPLVQQPRQDVQRVVIARPAPEPIVIARAAVELIVRNVLELQPQVLPGHHIDLGNQAVILWAAGTTPHHGRRGVEQGVARAARDERRERESVPRADVVHGVHSERAQCVRGVRRAPRGPRLFLVDPRAVEGEAVRPERVHVREVQRQIGEPIWRWTSRTCTRSGRTASPSTARGSTRNRRGPRGARRTPRTHCARSEWTPCTTSARGTLSRSRRSSRAARATPCSTPRRPWWGVVPAAQRMTA